MRGGRKKIAQHRAKPKSSIQTEDFSQIQLLCTTDSSGAVPGVESLLHCQWGCEQLSSGDLMMREGVDDGTKHALFHWREWRMAYGDLVCE